MTHTPEGEEAGPGGRISAQPKPSRPRMGGAAGCVGRGSRGEAYAKEDGGARLLAAAELPEERASHDRCQPGRHGIPDLVVLRAPRPLEDHPVGEGLDTSRLSHGQTARTWESADTRLAPRQKVRVVRRDHVPVVEEVRLVAAR